MKSVGYKSNIDSQLGVTGLRKAFANDVNKAHIVDQVALLNALMSNTE